MSANDLTPRAPLRARRTWHTVPGGGNVLIFKNYKSAVFGALNLF
jgi:hypothetical protein